MIEQACSLYQRFVFRKSVEISLRRPKQAIKLFARLSRMKSFGSRKVKKFFQEYRPWRT
jgi:hypothetical protein